VVLEVLLHDLELRAPLLVVVGDSVDLGHDHVHDVVLLIPLQGNLLGLGMVLQCGVEDLFLDRLVDDELLLDLRE
jgi:hypothetical protein